MRYHYRRTPIPDTWSQAKCEREFPRVKRCIVEPLNEALLLLKMKHRRNFLEGRTPCEVKILGYSPQEKMRKMKLQFMGYGFPALYWSEFLRWDREKPSMLHSGMEWAQGKLCDSRTIRLNQIKVYSL